jgi:hypothetical protein
LTAFGFSAEVLATGPAQRILRLAFARERANVIVAIDQPSRPRLRAGSGQGRVVAEPTLLELRPETVDRGRHARVHVSRPLDDPARPARVTFREFVLPPPGVGLDVRNVVGCEGVLERSLDPAAFGHPWASRAASFLVGALAAASSISRCCVLTKRGRPHQRPFRLEPRGSLRCPRIGGCFPRSRRVLSYGLPEVLCATRGVLAKSLVESRLPEPIGRIAQLNS